MAELLPDVPHLRYHQDDLPGAPRFSRSVAATMLSKSPLAAWAAHPKLGNRAPRKDTKATLMGSLCHALLLGGGQQIKLVEGENYRGKRGGEKREALYLGQIPALPRELSAAREAKDAIALRLTVLLGDLAPLDKEATILWDDAGVSCKARLDLIAPAQRLVIDPKFPDELNVAKWEKLIRWSPYYQMQAHAYTSAMQAVTGEPHEMLFAICEWTYPFDVALIPAGGSVIEAGRIRWEQQREVWRRCLESGLWPGVGRRPAVEVPAEEIINASGLSAEERLDALFGEDEDGDS